MSKYPNLAGVLVKGDVFKKGKADYAPWARMANYMHEHAPGWQFAIRETPTGDHFWRAPNGTGYIIGYFTGPDGQQTPDFPYSAMNHRNEPVKLEQCSARVLTDTHRRGFCACAAFTFGLAYELWAREEVSEAAAPVAEESHTVSQREPAPEGVSEDQMPIDKAEMSEIMTCLKQISLKKPDDFKEFTASIRKKFGWPANAKISDRITERQHAQFCQTFIGGNADVFGADK